MFKPAYHAAPGTVAASVRRGPPGGTAARPRRTYPDVAAAGAPTPAAPAALHQQQQQPSTGTVDAPAAVAAPPEAPPAPLAAVAPPPLPSVSRGLNFDDSNAATPADGGSGGPAVPASLPAAEAAELTAFFARIQSEPVSAMRGHATPLMAMALAHWQRNGAADDAARAGGGDPAVGPAGFSAADPLLDPFTAFVAARVRAMGDTRASTLLLNVRGEERGGVRLSSTAPPFFSSHRSTSWASGCRGRRRRCSRWRASPPTTQSRGASSRRQPPPPLPPRLPAALLAAKGTLLRPQPVSPSPRFRCLRVMRSSSSSRRAPPRRLPPRGAPRPAAPPPRRQSSSGGGGAARAWGRPQRRPLVSPSGRGPRVAVGEKGTSPPWRSWHSSWNAAVWQTTGGIG